MHNAILSGNRIRLPLLAVKRYRLCMAAPIVLPHSRKAAQPPFLNDNQGRKLSQDTFPLNLFWRREIKLASSAKAAYISHLQLPHRRNAPYIT